MGSLILVLACLVLSAFFSSSETALLRLQASAIDTEPDQARGPSAHAIRDLLRSTSRLLVTILLGNNVVNILGASVASALAISLLGAEAGVAAATVTMTLLVLVFCEILPKALAAAHPEGIAHIVALPLYLFHQTLRPVHRLFDRVIEPMVKRLVGGTELAPDSTEEILRLARRARLESTDETPLTIMGATAGAAGMTVMEIMVPRTEILALAAQTPPAELLDRMLEERYTRVPIYDPTIDTVKGFVHLKDLVKLVRSGGTDLGEIMKPVLRVPERKPILRLLTEMQRSFTHVAMVKDEHGTTLGLVTQEDILEEIVGEIRDEFDQEELRAIRTVGDGAFEALGRVLVRDFNRETGYEIPAERGDTLSGMVFNALGRSPRRGDVVHTPGYEIRVVDMAGPRIARVRVRPEAGPDGRGRSGPDEVGAS